MLLVAHQDMGNKRALTRQEWNGHLNCFTVPVLRVFSLKCLVLNLFFKLVQEPIFRAHAKVTDGKETQFLQHEFSRELEL